MGYIDSHLRNGIYRGWASIYRSVSNASKGRICKVQAAAEVRRAEVRDSSKLWGVRRRCEFNTHKDMGSVYKDRHRLLARRSGYFPTAEMETAYICAGLSIDRRSRLSPTDDVFSF